MKSIVLCAGYATRLYPLTLNMPKALLPIDGKAVLGYINDKIEEIEDVDAIYVVTNSKFYPKFESWALQERNRISKDLFIVDDGTATNESRLGGVGDLWLAIQRFGLDDDLLVILGDNLFDFNLREMAAAFRQDKNTLVAGYELNDISQLSKMGVLTAKDGILQKFEEKPQNPQSNLASTGIYLFRREDIAEIRRYMGTDSPKEGPGYLILEWMKQRPISVFPCEGFWVDIGSKEIYEELSRNGLRLERKELSAQFT